MTDKPFYLMEPGSWKPGRVYRVVDAHDKLMCESSEPNDDAMLAALADGGKLLRQHHFEPHHPVRWAEAELPPPWSPRAPKRETTDPAPQRPNTFMCICPHVHVLNFETGDREYASTIRIPACLAEHEGDAQ